MIHLSHSMFVFAAARPALLWTVFALTYAGIALGRVPGLALDRTGIAMLGAVAMLVVGAVSPGAAMGMCDAPTLALLFGLMVFSEQLYAAGFYDWIGRKLSRLADRPRLLLAGLIGASALVSALLANDIVCLAFTPLLCGAMARARRDPIPYLIALATSANIGSAATLIGNPQNMYIGSVAMLPFGHFTLLMVPPILVSLVLCWIAVTLIMGKRLNAIAPPQGENTPVDSTTHPALDQRKVVKTIALLAGLVVALVLVHGTWRAVAALIGAGILLVSRDRRAARLYQRINWGLILLFIGLFVVNGTMQRAGLTGHALDALTALGLDLHSAPTLAALSTLWSNLVSNVPAVLSLAPAVGALHQPRAWYLLSLVCTLAGNLTLVGSIANLIVAETARPFGVQLDLATYCKVGIPLALVTITLGTAWIMWAI